jgi:hypothetical protein
MKLIMILALAITPIVAMKPDSTSRLNKSAAEITITEPRAPLVYVKLGGEHTPLVSVIAFAAGPAQESARLPGCDEMHWHRSPTATFLVVLSALLVLAYGIAFTVNEMHRLGKLRLRHR